MSLFPEGNGLNKNHDPGIWSTTPEFGSKRTPHLRSTVPNVQRHMAYFAKMGAHWQAPTGKPDAGTEVWWSGKTEGFISDWPSSLLQKHISPFRLEILFCFSRSSCCPPRFYFRPNTTTL
jgi:hypothetical protein